MTNTNNFTKQEMYEKGKQDGIEFGEERGTKFERTRILEIIDELTKYELFEGNKRGIFIRKSELKAKISDNSQRTPNYEVVGCNKSKSGKISKGLATDKLNHLTYNTASADTLRGCGKTICSDEGTCNYCGEFIKCEECKAKISQEKGE